jgi:hypothetical protein
MPCYAKALGKQATERLKMGDAMGFVGEHAWLGGSSAWAGALANDRHNRGGVDSTVW